MSGQCIEERAGKSCFSSSYGWIEGAEGVRVGGVPKREKQKRDSSKKEEVIQPRRVYELCVSGREEYCVDKRECEKETVRCRVNIHPIAVSACASGNQRRLNIIVVVVVVVVIVVERCRCRNRRDSAKLRGRRLLLTTKGDVNLSRQTYEKSTN